MKSWMLFELLGFLLSTNAKIKKITTVSAVMFEIVEMYRFQIHLHYFVFSVLYVKAKPWFILFLNLFQNLYTSDFFEKIFPVFVDWLSLSWKSNDQGGLKFWTCLHATLLLAVKYSRTVKCPSPLKRLGIFASPLNRYF
jgi:hypothetical protein